MSRGNIGLVYTNTRGNPQFVSNYRESPQIQNSMAGEGIVDTVKSVYQKGKMGLTSIMNNYTGDLGTAIRNAIPDSDNTARSGFSGEKHAILKLQNGKMGVANYMGPGTNVMARLKRGDPGRTETDRASMAHDIRYGLAQNIGDIRDADRIMMTAVDRASRNKTDAPMNIAQARLIKAKMGLEDVGLLKKDAFGGKDNIVSPEDKAFLTSKLKGLEQQGYGKKKLLPGDALKIKLLKQMSGKGVSASRDLGGVYKMSGSGILDFVVENVIPKLMKTVGIKENAISKNQLKNIISKSMSLLKTGNMENIIDHLGKTILPILTNLKMGGNGNIKTQIKNKLLKSLKTGLKKSFKNYVKGKQGGKGMVGDGFWGDFKKGFLSVFKPGAKILGGVASALGQPEIGIPLEILSSAL